MRFASRHRERDGPSGGDFANGRGTLLHYSGGLWTAVVPPSVSANWYLWGVHFTPPGQGAEGWAVGRDGTNQRGVILHLTPPAATWSGAVSFSNKVTSLSGTESEDRKFQSSTSTLTGTVEVYIRGNAWAANGEGCYMKFTGDDGSTFCIKQIASLATDVAKNKTDQFLLTGTGEITLPIGGTPQSGIIYLDAKGTLKKSGTGEVTSVSLSGKIGGGSDGLFIMGASLKATLTKVSE